jgi:hypothetical protein
MAKSTKLFQNTVTWLKKAKETDISSLLAPAGSYGVTALAAATPKDTGDTAWQWRYEIRRNGPGRASLIFCNDHVNDGANIAILLQYGHGTGTGGYVTGTDYINPALRATAEKILNEAVKLLNG